MKYLKTVTEDSSFRQTVLSLLQKNYQMKKSTYLGITKCIPTNQLLNFKIIICVTLLISELIVDNYPE